ncbi:hypothetical protein V8C86DRAFT_2542577 [Haematococcus lacustris]
MSGTLAAAQRNAPPDNPYLLVPPPVLDEIQAFIGLCPRHPECSAPQVPHPAAALARHISSEAAQDAIEGERLQHRILQHPLFPKFLDALTACRKAGLCSGRHLPALDAQCIQAKKHANAALQTSQSHQCLLSAQEDGELQAFMGSLVSLVEAHRDQLDSLQQEAEGCSKEFEAQISNLATGTAGAQPKPMPQALQGAEQSAVVGGAGDRPASRSLGATSDSSSGLSSTVLSAGTIIGLAACAEGTAVDASSGGLTEGAQLGSMLKKRYANQISALQEEFNRKRSKGKLPDEATEVLKEWWQQNLCWPYPTEDDKAILCQSTGLNGVQVNNWFINQRKRHWHKYFPKGPPHSAEEAAQVLRAMGVVP